MKRSTHAIVGAFGASLVLASIAAGIGHRNQKRPQLLAKATLDVRSSAAAPRFSSRGAAAVQPARATAATPRLAPLSSAPGADPFYDAPACAGLEVVRASETQAGGDAFVEIARGAEAPKRLHLGDSLDNRLLTFVGEHPRDARLTVVFEGEAGTCRAELRSTELALQRTELQANLSTQPNVRVQDARAWNSENPRADQAHATSEFALALDGTRPNRDDFLPTAQGER